jgi:hypothetical protein
VITYERRAGRLVEIRPRGEFDLSTFGRVIALANELGPDAKVVALVDARAAAPLSPEQRKKLATVQRGSRERIELEIVLLPEGASRMMTMDRLRVESGLQQRIVFSPDDALAELRQLLSAAELTRARQFLEEK